MIDVMRWILLIFLWVIGIGFSVGAIIFLLGIFFQFRRDKECAFVYAICVLIMGLFSAGSIFVALAMGRDLL